MYCKNSFDKLKLYFFIEGDLDSVINTSKNF